MIWTLGEVKVWWSRWGEGMIWTLGEVKVWLSRWGEGMTKIAKKSRWAEGMNHRWGECLGEPRTPHRVAYIQSLMSDVKYRLTVRVWKVAVCWSWQPPAMPIVVVQQIYLKQMSRRFFPPFSWTLKRVMRKTGGRRRMAKRICLCFWWLLSSPRYHPLSSSLLLLLHIWTRCPAKRAVSGKTKCLLISKRDKSAIFRS